MPMRSASSSSRASDALTQLKRRLPSDELCAIRAQLTRLSPRRVRTRRYVPATYCAWRVRT
eukprot:6182330-Pleurochrysis_carterae.AAC.1